jgi:LuxR family maltose regulon positive regulatory protein
MRVHRAVASRKDWIHIGGVPGGRVGDPHEAPLLGSKLVVPPLPATLVERPRLHRLLDAGASSAITMLAAPAGYGKTVLLGAWLRAGGPGAPVAWLSVEPGDEGPRFWSYVHAALISQLDGHDGGHSLPAPGAAPDDAFLPRLADALARLPEPVVLILDDLHHVHGADALSGLEFLLRHSADRLRLVVGTRADPALALHQRRLRGELTEIRSGELAFTTAETVELLTRHGVTLPAEHLNELQDHSEGWPAGVRLTALSIQEQSDPALVSDQLAGHHPRVADYLRAEVLAGQSGDTREVLMCTAILGQVCGGLVDALLGRTDGSKILAELQRVNAFVIPVGADAYWCRYHRMFGELLRAELRRQAPERIPSLHHRAAEWYAAHGLPVDALRHALFAQDSGYATAVLRKHWRELVWCGHPETMRTVVPVPPAVTVGSDPELALAHAADCIDIHDLDGADHYLRIAETQRPSGEDGANSGLAAAVLRLAWAQLGNDPTAVIAAASRLLASVKSAADDADDGAKDDRVDDGGTAIALAALGSANLGSGDLDAAQIALGDGLALADRAGLVCPRLVCASSLAFVQAVRGELRSADRTARAALGMPPCPGPSRRAHTAHAYTALAIVDIHWDRLCDAESHLNLAARSCDPLSEPALAASIAIVRAQLLREQGDLTEGYKVLLNGRRGVGDWRPPRYLEQWSAAVEADLRTCHGDTGTVRKSLAPLVEHGHGVSAPLAVALARAYLRDDDPGAAARVLPTWADDDCAGQAMSLRLDAGLIEAMAARRTGDDRRASRTLERVLELAEPEGFRRVFTHAGTPARELLLEHLDSGTAYWSMVSELLAATREAGNHGGAPPLHTEPLTVREQTILRYLQSILSNVEIASELSLSVNTVKTHVRNIYRKLDATRRGDAVRRARELHLL